MDIFFIYKSLLNNGSEPHCHLQSNVLLLLVHVTQAKSNFYRQIDIFVNCNWVVTRWQQYSTHLHTNNIQNDTKQTIHRITQKFWKSLDRAPSWLVIPWHLPYNCRKSKETPQSGQPKSASWHDEKRIYRQQKYINIKIKYINYKIKQKHKKNKYT